MKKYKTNKPKDRNPFVRHIRLKPSGPHENKSNKKLRKEAKQKLKREQNE